MWVLLSKAKSSALKVSCYLLPVFSILANRFVEGVQKWKWIWLFVLISIVGVNSGINSVLWLQKNFAKSSEVFGMWSEIFGKSSKTPSYVYIIKRTLHVSSKIWILCSRDRRTISHEWAHCSRHSNIKLISSRHRVISSIFYILIYFIKSMLIDFFSLV